MGKLLKVYLIELILFTRSSEKAQPLKFPDLSQFVDPEPLE